MHSESWPVSRWKTNTSKRVYLSNRFWINTRTLKKMMKTKSNLWCANWILFLYIRSKTSKTLSKRVPKSWIWKSHAKFTTNNVSKTQRRTKVSVTLPTSLNNRWSSLENWVMQNLSSIISTRSKLRKRCQLLRILKSGSFWKKKMIVGWVTIGNTASYSLIYLKSKSLSKRSQIRIISISLLNNTKSRKISSRLGSNLKTWRTPRRLWVAWPITQLTKCCQSQDSLIV